MIALLSAHGGLKINSHASDVLALPNLSSAKPGFVDRLIHGASYGQGHTFVTFEKAAQKLSDAHVLGINS